MAPLREPREDAIMDIVSMTGLQREEAIRWSKAYDNDANKAMDAFFDNPNAIHDQQSQVRFDEQRDQIRWDENQFHVDEANNTLQSQSHSAIHPTDALRPGVFDDAAPSRPPSRVGARAPTTADGASQRLGLESEDDQVKRAMVMSMGDRRTVADQETGVLDHKAFGPATREHYETEKWAMTVAAPQTQEIHLNPEPFERQRPQGTPAFLKPAPSGHRLPALLKILHAIPMAREALLNRNCMLSDYGHDKDWWDGSAIKLLRIVNLASEGKSGTGNDVVHESQRLMAFLDETERSYGSTEVLAHPDVIGDYHADKITGFYNQWHLSTAECAPDSPWVNIFESIGTKNSIDSSRSQPFHCLSITIEDEVARKGLTLYDSLDRLLWGDNKDDEETFLEKVGEVFTLDVRNEATNSHGLGIDVPAVWYADRYLSSSTKQVKDMFSRKASVSAVLNAQEKGQAALTQYLNPATGTSTDASQILSRAKVYLETNAKYGVALKQYSSAKGSANTTETSESENNLAQELRLLDESISHRMETFEKAREIAYAHLEEISRLYTKPSEHPEHPPHHKYTLRGVSTNPHTLYVLERTKPEDENDMLSTEAQDWQWWKLEFLGSDAGPVVHQKVTEEVVLKSAHTESTSALLVYASEAAISYQSEDLPSQLRNFVRADNLNFHQELEQSGHPKPATPTKRKVHQEDGDGLASRQQRFSHSRDSVERTILSKSLDPKPPDNNHPSDTSALPSQRNIAAKSGEVAGYNDMNPTSFQNGSTTTDTKHSLSSTAGMSNGQEMQEKDGGRRLLRDRTDYVLGSYVPEINMEKGDEDDEDPKPDDLRDDR